jgi:hypothetical protein
VYGKSLQRADGVQQGSVVVFTHVSPSLHVQIARPQRTLALRFHQPADEWLIRLSVDDPSNIACFFASANTSTNNTQVTRCSIVQNTRARRGIDGIPLYPALERSDDGSEPERTSDSEDKAGRKY